jgi:glycosyltransferase involved in cell wall biosynthesis
MVTTESWQPLVQEKEQHNDKGIMKILFLGDITGYIDEGMKNTTFNLMRELEKKHDVMVVHPRQTVRLKTLKEIKMFAPDIIHYMHGPTPRSFIITKMLSLLHPTALTVMSVPKPTATKSIRFILPAMKPKVFLLQSRRNEGLFKDSGAVVDFLYPGINLEKFRPVSENTKMQLRDKYGLPADKFVLLHVGHISPQRGVNMLCGIQREFSGTIQTIVVGALTMKPDDAIASVLKDAGCQVWLRHFESIEEVYQLADCYIFPGMHNTSAIEIPLTVLEAMACNLPVISDRFGGLPDLLEEGDGFYFVSDKSGILSALTEVKKGNIRINTCEKVKKFSWERIAKRLETIYMKQRS